MALSAARMTQSRNLGAKRRIPVKASTTIYAGGLVMVDSGGYARPAAALASNKNVAGVATETVVGTGADGGVSITVQEGEYLFVGVSLTQASIATAVYASDDLTFSTTQASNEPKAGICTDYVSATSGWVKVGMGV